MIPGARYPDESMRPAGQPIFPQPGLKNSKVYAVIDGKEDGTFITNDFGAYHRNTNGPGNGIGKGHADYTPAVRMIIAHRIKNGMQSVQQLTATTHRAVQIPGPESGPLSHRMGRSASVRQVWR